MRLMPIRARLAVCALAAALAVSACSSPTERKAGFLQKGESLYSEKNYYKALLEFRNALQLDPNDAHAMARVAEAAEKAGNMREAVKQYQYAVNADPAQVHARAQMARLYVMSGDPDKALEYLQPGFERTPQDPELLMVRAAARQQKGDKAGARADAELSVKLAPDNEYGVAVLASLYTAAGESQLALDLVQKAVDGKLGTPDMRTVLAQQLRSAGRKAEAVAQLRKVVELEPDKLVNRYRLAQVLVADKDVAGAEAVLREAVAHAKDDVDAKLMLADFIGTHRGDAAALQELEKMGSAAPKDTELRLGIALFHATHGDLPGAETMYRKLIAEQDTKPAGLVARNRLARALIVAGKREEASKLLAEVLKEDAHNPEALAARADISLAAGQPDAAIADLRAALRDQPSAVDLQRTLARAYLQNEDRTLAEETLRAALEANPTATDAQLDLAQLLVRNGRAGAALPMLQKLNAGLPGDNAVLQTLIAAQLALKDAAGAKRTAEQLQAVRPGSATASYLSGLASAAAGDRAAAQAAFERALGVSPDALEPVTGLVQLALTAKQPDAAVARLDAAIRARPDNPALRALRGDVLAALGRFEPARVSYREAILRAPEWTVPYRSLASLDSAQGHPADAEKTLQQGLAATKNAPPLVAALAQLYETQGQVDDAVRLYEDLLRRSPDSQVAANNLAMLLATHRTDKASLDRAKSLVAPLASSHDAGYVDTLGWVLYKRGEYNDAATTLDRALRMAPGEPTVAYHLGMTHLALGHRDEARSALQKAVDQGQDFRGAAEAKKALEQLRS